MNSKDKGDISEAVVAAEFLKLGIPVSKPLGDNQPYDLIIDFNCILKKVQIKTARNKGDYTLIPTSKSINTYLTKDKRRTSYKDKVDFIVAYCHTTNECYVIDVNEVGNVQVTLRENLPINKQIKGIRYKKDYLLTYSLMVKHLTDIQKSVGSIPAMST